MDFKVDQLQLTSSGETFDAFKIYPAETKATEFSITKIYPSYKFASADPHKIYKYDGKTFELIVEITDMVVEEYKNIEKDISNIEDQFLIVIVPSSFAINTYLYT